MNPINDDVRSLARQYAANMPYAEALVRAKVVIAEEAGETPRLSQEDVDALGGLGNKQVAALLDQYGLDVLPDPEPSKLDQLVSDPEAYFASHPEEAQSDSGRKFLAALEDSKLDDAERVAKWAKERDDARRQHEGEVGRSATRDALALANPGLSPEELDRMVGPLDRYIPEEKGPTEVEQLRQQLRAMPREALGLAPRDGNVAVSEADAAAAKEARRRLDFEYARKAGA